MPDNHPNYIIPVITDGLKILLDAIETTFHPSNNVNFNDLSGNNVISSLEGNPAYNDSNGGCLVFDGTNCCRVGEISGYKTINMWCYITAKTGYLVDARPASSSGYMGLFYNELGSDWIKFYVNGALVPTNLASLPINTWFNLYAVNRGTITGSMSLFNRYLLVDKEWLKGKLTFFSAYNRELSLSEIQYNFNALKQRHGL